jgi:hypothetical protein
MERGDPASEILQKVLRCFKINRPSGMVLELVDSGFACISSFALPVQPLLLVQGIPLRSITRRWFWAPSPQMMMMSFICSCRNKNQPKAIYPKGTSNHTRLFRGPSTNGMKKLDGPSRSWPTPHTTPGQYHVMNFPRFYEMTSLDFTILSTPALERCGYDFRLNSNSSRLIISGPNQCSSASL